ncbi:MAG: hypothetical protein R3322_14870 [Kiloniellales bacterium]|nr:hypothetical protein [Kiloniellales bacterium]
MESQSAQAATAARSSPDQLARALACLYAERFGGATSGKFRISRKFMRQLAGRRKLPDSYIARLAEDLFEAGFVLIDCETYFVVLSQKQFASYRRVTAAAVNRVMPHEESHREPATDRDPAGDRPEIQDIEQRSVQKAPNIH